MQTFIDIKHLRKTRRITQEQLGILCGMNKSQISRMEKGTLGSPETLSRVLTALGYAVKLDVIDCRGGMESDTERVLDILKSYKEYNAEKYGIMKIGLFGSYSRHEQTEESDIDICIQLQSPSLLKYAQIENELKGVLKKHIDLLPITESLSSNLKYELEKDAIYV